MKNHAAILALTALALGGEIPIFKTESKERNTNKYNLTEQQIEDLKQMTPKQKKVFLKGLR